LVDFIAAPEMRHWPTFRAFSLSPFRRRPAWRRIRAPKNFWKTPPDAERTIETCVAAADPRRPIPGTLLARGSHQT
jgi:hypothetical protein